MNSIKSEAFKLLSVKSTYITMFIAIALVALTAFYVEGYWGQSGSAAGTLQSTAYKEIIGNSVGLAAMFVSIIAILQVGHEYKYNTIAYTLTSTSRRTKVFLSKALVLGAFSIVFGLFIALFSLIAYTIGIGLRGEGSLPAQDLSFMLLMSRVSLYSLVYGLFGFLLTMLVRSVIFSIVILMMLPSTVEPLLGLLLKDNARYLPMSTFDHIMGVAIGQTSMTQNFASVLSILYIGVFGLIVWLSFVRRDAN